jgi:hypothetical protein
MASDYANIIQSWGPASYSTKNGGLWLLDETTDASSAADSMRTAAMVTLGMGSAATAHTISKNGVVTLGVAGQSLLTGAADYCARFNGTGHLLPDDTDSDFNFAAASPFSGGLRLEHNTTAAGGAAEWGLITRLVDTTNYRGFRFVLRRNGSGQMWTRFWVIDNIGTSVFVYAEDQTDLSLATNYSLAFGTTGIQTFSTYTGDGATTTVTTAAVHGLRTGDKVLFCATASANLNGQRTITVTSTTQFTVTSTYNGTSTTGTWVHLWIDVNGARNNNVLAVGTTTSVATITGGTLRIGADDNSTGLLGGATTAAAYVAGAWVTPRCIPPESIDDLHTAATTAATTRVLSRNLGVIKAALAGNPLLRGAGDSTTATGGTSVADALPRRLKTDGRINRRAGHFKTMFAYISGATDATYISAVAGTEVNGTPAVPWATPVGAKPGMTFVTLTHTVTPTPTNTREVFFNDSPCDPFDSTTWTAMTGRFVFATANSVNATITNRYQITDGTTTAVSADTTANGTDTKWNTVDVPLGAATAGTIVARVVGTADDESSKVSGQWGVMYCNGTTVAATSPGLWYLGSSGLDGSTTATWKDDTIFAMSTISGMDTAVTTGISFSAKVVVFFITINDVNGGFSAATIYANLVLIAARWTALGYKVLFVQQWIPYLSSTTSATSRVPTADYDDVWTNAFLPVAGGNVAVASIAQRWRGVPHQYLEGPTSPAYSIHAVDSHGALRLTIPLSQTLSETTLGGGGTSETQFMMQNLLSDEE